MIGTRPPHFCSLSFCVVYYRPFPWCRWRVFLAKALRKDWLLPCSDRMQAERKRCAQSWHRHAFCRIRKGNKANGAGQGTAPSQSEKFGVQAPQYPGTSTGVCRGALTLAGHALQTGMVRHSQPVLLTLASWWQLCLKESANGALFTMPLLEGHDLLSRMGLLKK